MEPSVAFEDVRHPSAQRKSAFLLRQITQQNAPALSKSRIRILPREKLSSGKIEKVPSWFYAHEKNSYESSY